MVPTTDLPYIHTYSTVGYVPDLHNTASWRFQVVGRRPSTCSTCSRESFLPTARHKLFMSYSHNKLEANQSPQLASTKLHSDIVRLASRQAIQGPIP